MDAPASVDETAALLRRLNYVGDRNLAVVVFLALKLQRPLLLEGEPGVGKTELAKALSIALFLSSSRYNSLTRSVGCQECPIRSPPMRLAANLRNSG